MENATKALLIAVAVLIVILVIALGMKVFNSAGDVSTQSDKVGAQIETSTSSALSSATSEMEIAEIKNLLGDNKTGTEAITLANKIISINKTSEHNIILKVFTNEHYRGEYYSTRDGKTPEIVKSYLKAEKYYKISATDDSNKYINEIVFWPK